MTGPIRVILELGFELVAAEGERRFEFYQAEVELVGLESGRSMVRFYLPPERVKRDVLRAAPKYWRVRLSTSGGTQPDMHEQAARALADEAVRLGFQREIAQVASGNRGVLVPQYLTPFALEYPDATPSFIRRDFLQ